MKAIWPDSFVEDANLTVNVSLLRKALGETDSGMPYIETVPRKGYRFNASVVMVEADTDDGARPEPAILERSDLQSGTGILEHEKSNAKVFPGVAAGERSIPLSGIGRRPAMPEIIPFPEPRRMDDRDIAALPETRWSTTEDKGRQDAGGSIVVPAAPDSRWPTTQDQGRQDAHPTAQFWPWLASGLIAVALVVVGLVWHHASHPAPTPQLIQRRLTSFGPETAVTAAAISTGAKFVAYANPNGLFVQVVATGDIHTLLLPAPRFRVASISWFPDSAELLVDGASPGDDTRSLWIVPVIGSNSPTRLGPYPPGVVSPDGSEIAWLNGPIEAPRIQTMSAAGGPVRTVLTGSSGETFGGLSWRQGGRSLLFTRYRWNAQLRGNSGSIDCLDLASGKTVRVISARDLGGDAVSLPDGRILYSKTLGANPFAYGGELVAVQTDPRTGVAVGAPSVIDKWNAPITDLTVNSSGTRLAVRDLVLEHNAYLGDLEDRGTRLTRVRRFTFGVGSEDFPRAWAPDSKAVFIDSNRTGHWEIFRQALDSSFDEPFIQGPDDQFSPSLSPDGAWLLYIERPRSWRELQPASIMRVPVSGGLPQLVLKAPGFSGWGLRFQCPRIRGMPCVLVERQGDQIAFRTFDPATGFQQGSNALARTGYLPGSHFDWSLAPDGLTIAWIRMNPTDNRIHVLPLARNGSSVATQGPERDVTVAGGGYIETIAPSPEGRGWYLIRQLPGSWTLLYADPEGRTRPLLTVPSDFPTDLFPSPDGRHLAFSEQSFTSNVWLLEHF